MGDEMETPYLRETVKALRRMKHHDLPDGRETLLQKVRRWQRLKLPHVPLDQIPHRRRWSELFEEMRDDLLRDIEGDVAVEHIGSSAIPALMSKNVIDLAIAAAGTSRKALLNRLAYQGFESYGQGPGSPDVLWFWKLDHPESAFVAHLCEFGDPWWQNALDFRDYLRAHPIQARRYEERKTELATTESSPLLYSLGKIELLLKINQLAREWRLTGAPDD